MLTSPRIPCTGLALVLNGKTVITYSFTLPSSWARSIRQFVQDCTFFNFTTWQRSGRLQTSWGINYEAGKNDQKKNALHSLVSGTINLFVLAVENRWRQNSMEMTKFRRYNRTSLQGISMDWVDLSSLFVIFCYSFCFKTHEIVDGLWNWYPKHLL